MMSGQSLQHLAVNLDTKPRPVGHGQIPILDLQRLGEDGEPVS
jgi:hypothetical protein